MFIPTPKTDIDCVTPVVGNSVRIEVLAPSLLLREVQIRPLAFQRE